MKLDDWLDGTTPILEAEPLSLIVEVGDCIHDYWRDGDVWWGVDVTEDGVAITWCDDP